MTVHPFAPSDSVKPKPDRYAALVRARKAYDPQAAFGLANPSRVADGRYDAEEVGPWTRWAGDLDADLMVVGQDWGDEAYFVKNRGLDAPKNQTSAALGQLLTSVGRPLPTSPTADAPLAPDANRSTGVFLTNALLWLKRGGMQAPVADAWFGADSITFLREQLAIVHPRVVVGLGARAYRAILAAYTLPAPASIFRSVVEAPDGIRVPAAPGAPRLFGVYHCGARVQNTIRSLDEQRADWSRIRRALAMTD